MNVRYILALVLLSCALTPARAGLSGVVDVGTFDASDPRSAGFLYWSEPPAFLRLPPLPPGRPKAIAAKIVELDADGRVVDVTQAGAARLAPGRYRLAGKCDARMRETVVVSGGAVEFEVVAGRIYVASCSGSRGHPGRLTVTEVEVARGIDPDGPERLESAPSPE